MTGCQNKKLGDPGHWWHAYPEKIQDGGQLTVFSQNISRIE
jgi:hypothetical protein